MNQIHIAVLVGSLRREPFNLKLAHALAKLAPTDVSFTHLSIGNLPLYNQDDTAHQTDAVLRLKSDITGAHGLLFVRPEYNRSIPGVLKNAIDHASRPYGKSAWSGKPAGVLGVSVGAIGTALAQHHCATSWLAWIARRRPNRKRSFRPKTICSTPMATLGLPAMPFSRPGWISMWLGSRNMPAELL